VDLPPPVYVPPSMPTPEALGKGIKQAAADAHLIGQIEMSDLRPTDHGPGRFIVCIRGISNDIRTDTYAVFFKKNDYRGLRLPVIGDDCKKQTYSPAPIAAPEKLVEPAPNRRYSLPTGRILGMICVGGCYERNSASHPTPRRTTTGL
jgi:hypothetical protein